MASNIKNIIDELSRIAVAYSPVIGAFNFGDRSEINDKPAKSYPAIYISSLIESTTIERDANSHLPRSKNYPIQVIFWDTYNLVESSAVNLQTKYSDLEIIADRFWAEVNRRTITDPADTRQFYIDNFEDMVGNYITNSHVDDLVGISYNPIFRADNLQCTTGTFSY